MKKTIFLAAICVGFVVMMSARAAEKAENPSFAVSEKVGAIDAYVRSVEKIFPPPNAKNKCLSPVS